MESKTIKRNKEINKSGTEKRNGGRYQFREGEEGNKKDKDTEETYE